MDAGQAIPFGELLRRCRDRAALTQEALAERAGLSIEAISLLERGGRTRPQRHTVRQLADALGLAGADRAAFEAAARGPARRPAAPALPALPLAPTTFVGRDAELAAVAALLADPAVRLLTLTGPGGVGKTRLALEAAARTANRFPDGVAFVPLAALRESALLPGAIAGALGLAERRDREPLAAASAHLRDRRALLLLDNCEHLPDAAPPVAELLAACPRLVVLATSRIPLHLSAERQFPVPPLATPPPDSPAPPEGAGQTPAIALFAQRARAVAPTFVLTAANTADVAAICRRLDGLPLAIELAAAWVKILPPDQLLARLDRALPLLADGPRDLPARQRTLRDAIGWSDNLLAPAPRALLRRLSIFAGGFALAEAEAICVADGAPPGATLAALAALVDASLVGGPTESAAGLPPRYALLETVREYAAEQLEASGEAERIGRRHTAAFLALAEEAQPRLVGPEEATWLARLDAEHPNLRAALRRALDRGEADTAVRFAAGLWRFWAERAHLREGRRWLAEIIALARARPAPDDADPATGVTPLRLAMLLHVAGNLARAQGDYAPAEALYEECLAIRRTRGDQSGVMGALNNLGIVAHERGDDVRALHIAKEALPIARASGNPYGLAFTLAALGDAARAAGVCEQAGAHYAESLALFRQIGHSWGVALALVGLGDDARERGDAARAAEHYREALTLAHGLGERRITADALEGLARLALADDRPETATRLLGAAATLRERFDLPRAPIERDGHARALAAARDALGAAVFAVAWDAGAALSPDAAVALALGDGV